MSALQVLADQLRGEDTPISEHVVDPVGADEPGLSEEYAVVFEAVREGYLLHYGEPRLIAGHDADLGLLAGDYLYALGLDRLAALGDTDAVAVLSELNRPVRAVARRRAGPGGSGRSGRRRPADRRGLGPAPGDPVHDPGGVWPCRDRLNCLKDRGDLVGFAGDLPVGEAEDRQA